MVKTSDRFTMPLMFEVDDYDDDDVISTCCGVLNKEDIYWMMMIV